MKYSAKANLKMNEAWEYEQDKRQERKKTKEARNLRRNKRNVWDNSQD